MTKTFETQQIEAHKRAVSGNPDNRTGEEWEKFLASYRIKNITDVSSSKWEIESTSGNTYTVTQTMRMDEMGSYYDSWRCDCPARKQCRHIDAVIDMLATECLADEDYDAVNELIG